MEKLFSTPEKFEDVIITIEPEFITFKFVSDQRVDGSFYDFYIEDWDAHFKHHMPEKEWFTQEMSDFISQNIEL